MGGVRIRGWSTSNSPVLIRSGRAGELFPVFRTSCSELLGAVRRPRPGPHGEGRRAPPRPVLSHHLPTLSCYPTPNPQPQISSIFPSHPPSPAPAPITLLHLIPRCLPSRLPFERPNWGIIIYGHHQLAEWPTD